MTDASPEASTGPSTEPSTGHRPPRISRKSADRLSAAVYVVVAVIALIGQSLAAVHWLGWPMYAALPAVGGVELTAVALAARADYRRRKGERAIAARLLSGAVAAFMTAINFVGHQQIGQEVAAWFFASATAVGYLVWLLNSADRRRDQLAAEGKVRPSTPDYGPWQWSLHPIITRRARGLALRHPHLGLYGSLDLATEQLRREHRNRALAKVLGRRVAAAVDDNTAKIATLTYDMDEIAARLASGADYDGLTALIAADLAPEKLAASTDPRVIDGQIVATPPEADGEVDDRPPGQVVPIRPTSTRSRPGASTRRKRSPVAASVDEMADVLCREHCTPGHPAAIGKPTALATLKRVYGSCSGDRARAAKDLHNGRHASTGGVQDDDDQEDARWAG